MQPRIIGIAGASGSGKTTAADKLLEHYTPDNCLIISTDSYYKDQSHIAEEKRPDTNYDDPDSIDFDLLATHLKALLKGETVEVPQYDFSRHNRGSNTTPVKPKPYIIVEGILALHAQEIADLLEVKIFVKTDIYLCYERRKHRDIAQRGRTEEQVNKQFLATVFPMYHQFVQPSKNNADIVLKNIASNTSFNMRPLIASLDHRLQTPNQQTTGAEAEHKMNKEVLKQHSLFKHEKIKLVSLTPQTISTTQFNLQQ